MKNIAIQSINIEEENFFKLWLTLIQPYLKLRNKEADVLAKFIEYRFEISKRVEDEEEINFILFSTKIRNKIVDELDISNPALNNMISALRKKNYIVKNSINKKLIPNIEYDTDNFKLIYNVNIKRQATSEKN